MRFVRTMVVPYLGKDRCEASQGVQPLVRNKSDAGQRGYSDIFAVNSVGRTTWSQTMYRSAPLVPNGFLPCFSVFRFLSLLSIVFTPQSIFLCPFPGIASSLLTVRSRQPDSDSFLHFLLSSPS